MKNKMLVNIGALLLMGVMSVNVIAGGEKELKTPMLDVDIPAHTEKNWTVELNSGVNYGNVRADNQAYTMVPVDLTLSRRIDDVSLSGWNRGYTEFYARSFYDFIEQGPESRMIGLTVGPRYNFVQEGWRFIPFVDGNVGLGFVDSTKAKYDGYGQDFNFEFGVGAGVKYLITDNVYIRTTATYEHFSNAGLSDPIPNNPTDNVGVRVGVGFAF